MTATSNLPKSIWRLDFVTELRLNKCQLTQIPNRLANKLVNTITILDLSDNSIESIDAGLILLFRNLKQLILSNNSIKCIPLELVFVKTLIHLNLSRNQISKLPFTIGLMKNLKSLNLSHNRLDHFPESIIRPVSMRTSFLLMRLDSLDLSGNHQIGDRNFLTRFQSMLHEMNMTTSGNGLVSPPSLFHISARSVLRCSKAYRVLHSDLPRTVYHFLQQQAAICFSCAAACVPHSVQLIPGSAHFSLIANTVQSDAATHQIPIIRFTCWNCDLKTRVNTLQ